MVLRLLFTGLFLSGLWSHDFLRDKTANCRAGLGYNKTTRQNSEQCRERVEQNSYKVVQMLLFVAVTRSISRTCRADIVRMSHRLVLMSQKLVDKFAPGGANFYTARSDENWRHIHDVCTSLCDTSTTSARHAYEMKTRTRILNRLKFSPLLAEYLRHTETYLRHVKTFVRVPHDTWRVIASYNSQQLVAQTRDSVTGA